MREVIDLIPVVGPPHGLEQLTMGNCLVSVLRQVPQQVEAPWGLGAYWLRHC